MYQGCARGTRQAKAQVGIQPEIHVPLNRCTTSRSKLGTNQSIGGSWLLLLSLQHGGILLHKLRVHGQDVAFGGSIILEANPGW